MVDEELKDLPKCVKCGETPLCVGCDEKGNTICCDCERTKSDRIARESYIK